MNVMKQQNGLLRRPTQQMAVRDEQHDIVESVALRLASVGKCYRQFARQWDRVRQWFAGTCKQYFREHWALRDFNLTIHRGATVGILGANGSGKSTLLQLIAGTLSPSEGRMEVHGRVAALLELGSGFHPEFTGWENIRLQASLLGLGEDEITERLPGISAFSELGEALEQPVRTYSSGMILRLGFSVAISVDPDILLVDEALAVGDLHFQQKCLSRIAQLKERGVTIVLVTHDISTTKRICDEAHVLEKGRLVRSGSTEEVCNWYVARMMGAGTPQTEADLGRHGNGQAVMTSWELQDEQGRGTDHCWMNQRYSLAVKIRFREQIKKPVLGFYLRDRYGTELLGTNTENEGIMLQGEAGSVAVVEFRFGLHVRPGAYTLCLGLVDDPVQPVCLDWMDSALVVEVHDPVPGRVVFGLLAESIEVNVKELHSKDAVHDIPPTVAAD